MSSNHLLLITVGLGVFSRCGMHNRVKQNHPHINCWTLCFSFFTSHICHMHAPTAHEYTLHRLQVLDLISKDYSRSMIHVCTRKTMFINEQYHNLVSLDYTYYYFCRTTHSNALPHIGLPAHWRLCMCGMSLLGYFLLLCAFIEWINSFNFKMHVWKIVPFFAHCGCTLYIVHVHVHCRLYIVSSK